MDAEQKEVLAKIQTKLYQLKQLMDIDAQNTNAPVSMSLIINSSIVFDQNNLQQAKFILGQLEEWVHDMVLQTGFQGCLADL